MRTAKPEPAPIPTGALPKGWTWGRIEDVVGPKGVYIDGDWVESKDQDPDGDVRLIQLADVGDGYYVNKSNRFLTAAKARELGCTFLQTGDVLVARMPDPLGRACIFPGDKKQAVTVVDVCIARSGSPDVDHQWLMHAINAPSFRTAIGFLQSGSTRARISRGNLSTLWLPVPPSKEQQRIVAALDERLSELDASVASLERAERNLVRYRAAVLAAACSGKLVPTEANLARRAGRSYESADQLLARILAERRKANTKAKYEEPAQPDTSKLPKLPEGWAWATMGQMADVRLGKMLSAKAREASLEMRPYLRNENVRWGWVDTSDLKVMGFESDEITRYTVNQGDLVICEGGEAGRCAVYRAPASIMYQKAIHRLRPYGDLVSVDFLQRVFECGVKQGRWFPRFSETTIQHLPQEKLLAVAVPLPPVAEQERIIAEVERHLSRADALAASIAQSKRRAQRLRRAILAAAFQGRLVPQDPNDEPASVLLDRIRAQAATAEAATAAAPRRGRPAAQPAAPVASASPPAMTPKRRGRPPGSKNKAKA